MTTVKKVEKEYFAGKKLKVFGPIGNQPFRVGKRARFNRLASMLLSVWKMVVLGVGVHEREHCACIRLRT